MENQTLFQRLNKKLVKNKEAEPSSLTSILELIRELGIGNHILGQEFEVYDAQGKLVYKVRQKIIAMPVLNTLLEELDTLKKIEQQNYDKPNKGKLPKTMKRPKR